MKDTNLPVSGHRYSPEDILKEKDRIEQLHGKWTAHNIRLSDNIYTITPHSYDQTHHRAKWFGLISEILLNKSLQNMRVLDIGCLEGGISLTLGSAGCSVIGIEIREANLTKAKFARDVLGLSNVQFIQGDMLKLAEYNLGAFDLIVCAGTLYHIDAPHILPFLQSLRQSCFGIVIFDTHFAVERREEFISKDGYSYYGRTFVESHYYTDDVEEKKKDLWGSLENNFSFWPTERSLINFFIDAGFKFVIKPIVPIIEWPWQDRGFWVAYPEIHHLISEEYRFPTGRLEDPSNKAPYHEMFDNDVQRNFRNPSTRLMSDD